MRALVAALVAVILFAFAAPAFADARSERANERLGLQRVSISAPSRAPNWRHGAPAMVSTAAWRTGVKAYAATSQVIAEAQRWIGSGNPTGTSGPWCRDYVNFVLERTGHHLADKSRMAVTALRLGPRVSNPQPGDLAVMGGHVTFFVGWAGEGRFLGLGGNQGHRVNVSQFASRSVIAFVRPD